MEACVRGFSYMIEGKAKMDDDLQFIEGGELERAWKTSRRQRIKQQEQKVWDEFVKEKDVVRAVLDDDPYQFLEHLPEACLKELMDKELEKMRLERDIEKIQKNEETQKGSGDTVGLRGVVGSRGVEDSRGVDEVEGGGPEESPTAPGAHYAEERHCDMFHVFEDDKDDDNSGNECAEEAAMESVGSACTVLGKDEPQPEEILAPVEAQSSSKSSENVSSIIESSIYCAKVKELRLKINEELNGIITFLEQQDLSRVEAEDLVRAGRRSAEFCARFNRIYMYQLHRQTQDIKRNNKVALPFAKHTQFQSQMVRIVSLHQNLLQAIQVFRRSAESVGVGSAGCGALTSLARQSRDAHVTATAVPAPHALDAHLTQLYDDEIPATCDKLDDEIENYMKKLTDHTTNMENKSNAGSKVMQVKTKKRPILMPAKPSAKTVSETEARLSMYSLETLRTNVNTKSSISNNYSSGTSKMHGSVKQSVDKAEQTTKSTRKSPRCGGPSMRAPGRGRRCGPRRDVDVRTMVEAVHLCTSSHAISRELSPRCTPRSRDRTPKKSQPPSPRTRFNVSPKAKHRRSSPKPTQALKAVLSSIKSEMQDSLELSKDSCISPHLQLSPISKIKCAKRNQKDVIQDGIEMDKAEAVHVTPREEKERVEEVECEKKRDKTKVAPAPGGRCEVTRLLRQLCGGDAAAGHKNERVTGAKNAQLLCVNGGSPRQPSTPQLLRILEETIQKKVPKHLFHKPSSSEKKDKLRLTFNISEKTSANVFSYRTKFVQYMLTSPMYANSAVGKPWEMIGSISEQIIDDLLLECAKEMQLDHVLEEIYIGETC